MFKYIYTYILIFPLVLLKAQTNLIPNSSFENHNFPCWAGMTFANDVIDWYRSKESPDYFNTCANPIAYPFQSSVPHNCVGFQQPHSGNSYAGIGLCIYTDPTDSSKIASECVGVKLIQKLKANRCYYGEFYMSLANISDTQINSLGMLFTSYQYTLAPSVFNNTIQPQIQWDTTKFISDTMSWVKVSGTFIAQGVEEYLTIGNFKDGIRIKKKFFPTNFATPCPTSHTTGTNYVYLDDVSLYELPQAITGTSNYTVCMESDSLLLGDVPYPGITYQWFVNGNAISTQSQIKVKPNATTNYVLQTTSCSTSIQTFAVTYNNICPPTDTVLIIPNTFTPNNDSINDVFRFKLSNVKDNMQFAVYNRWGNLVKEITSGEIKANIYSQMTILWDGRTTSGEPCNEGVYFYTLKYTDINGEQKSKNGYVSLFR